MNNKLPDGLCYYCRLRPAPAAEKPSAPMCGVCRAITDEQRTLDRNALEARADAVMPVIDSSVIVVWRFHEAPWELQCLSPHGGDEDWLAWFPPGNVDRPSWAEGGSFGCCDVAEITLKSGARVWIGAHS